MCVVLVLVHLRAIVVSVEVLHVAIISGTLFDLKIHALIALILHLPYLVTLLAFGSWHFLPQVVPAVFLSAV